jgi:hypothetical protein
VGDSRDIDEAIDLNKQALALCGPCHPDRGMSLNHLGNAVITRFDQQGDSRDLDEAITLYSEALALHAPPHPNRDVSLNNLASALKTKFN